MITEHVYSNLLRRDRSMRIVGDLAESWQAVRETTFVFRLRKGVKWHHGRDFTAEDVRYSFERLLDVKTASPWRSIWMILDRVEVVDATTVRFVTKRPFAPLLSYLAAPQYSAIVPREIVERHGDLKTVASGTGPFMLEHFAPGTAVVLQRNPSYYEPAVPLLDRIEFRITPDEKARLAEVNGKAAHYTWSANPVIDTVDKTVSILQTDPTSYCGQHGLAFNQTKPPFSDVRVRRAVSVGINRKELIAAVLGGRGQISTKIPPCDDEFSHAGDERSLPYYGADRALGRKLLAEAGLPGGLDATLEVPSAFPQTVRTGEVMREQLARIGVRATIVPLDWDTALENFIRTKYDGMAMLPLVWQPDPDAHMYDIFHSVSSINLGKFDDRIVDRLLEQGRATLEPISRAGIYRALQWHVADQAYMIFPYASGATEVLDERVKGYVPIPGAGPGSRSRQSFKQVWLAS